MCWRILDDWRIEEQTGGRAGRSGFWWHRLLAHLGAEPPCGDRESPLQTIKKSDCVLLCCDHPVTLIFSFLLRHLRRGKLLNLNKLWMLAPRLFGACN